MIRKLLLLLVAGLVALVLALALAGWSLRSALDQPLKLESERLMALGAGAVATVTVGWPVLLLMGEVPARRGSCRRAGRDC